MENANSLGNLIAYGAIVLFLLLLVVLFLRTTFMVGSVWLLAWTRRGEQTPPTPTTSDEDAQRER